MFGNHFYHATMRKSVAVFGTLFNDINVIRNAADGSVLNQVKVPLSYGPKEKFLSRLDQEHGRNQPVALKLPRMAFEITSLNIDPNQKLSKLNKIVESNASDSTKKKVIDQYTSYDIGMSLYVMAKSQDDGLQIVEQILPYFTPDYTVSIRPVDTFNFSQDVPVILNSVNIDDSYEGDYATRRVLIYQLDFTMKMKFYGPTNNNASIIREVNLDTEKLGTSSNTHVFEEINFAVAAGGTADDFAVITTIDDELAGVAYAASSNPSVDEGSALTINVTTTNVPDATTLYWTATSTADFATSSDSFTITNNTGQFTVTPTADLSTGEGAESFSVEIRTGSASGTIVETLADIVINDTSQATYSTSASANNIDEGSALTVTVTTNAPDLTTLYWTATNSEDFNVSSGSFDIANGTGSFTVTPTADFSTGEGEETFNIQIRSVGIEGTVVDTLENIIINDTSQATYSTSAAANNIDEGSTLAVTVTTTNVADATTLYWSTAATADFAISSGSFSITNNTGSFTVTPTADTTTEGSETFDIEIRIDSAEGTVVDTLTDITINDTSLSAYTINVTNNNANAYTMSGNDENGSVSGDNPSLTFNQGETVDFIVNAPGHPFYIKTELVTGTESQIFEVSGQGSVDGTVQWTMEDTGTFYYICGNHGAMNGTITVS